MQTRDVHWLAAGLRIVVISAAMLMLGYAGRAYHGEQLLVLAEGGRKTVADYEKLLLASTKANQWNDSAQLRLFDYYYSQKSYNKAIAGLQNISPGRNHWRGWERLGAGYEKLAYELDGPDEDVVRAGFYYDRVLRVNPAYKAGLERRGVLALKSGDWKTVEETAAKLEALDANSLNMVYMRARAAEAVGKHELARQLYSKLTASGQETTGALYTHQEIRQRLTQLGDLS